MTLELRPCAGDGDLAVSVGIYNATWPLEAISLEEARAFNERMDESEETVAFLDDKPVGSGVAAAVPNLPNRIFTLITVLPDCRRRGAGTALYGAVSSWARERGHDTLRVRAREDDPGGLEYALKRGFKEVSRETGLALDLRDLDTPAIAPPEAVEIASLAECPDAEAHLYDVAVETFPDIPDSEEYVFEARDEWLRHHFHGPAERADATFVALAENEPIGYAKLRVSPARPTIGLHGMTAVRRAWRGRGVAGALKRAQIRWALANGLDRLETTNELRNEPMQRVNVGLGYKPTPGSITLEGPLAP
jgi:GNAT superfamily N-acetyltransferase